jgi:hypothetical protein
MQDKLRNRLMLVVMSIFITLIMFCIMMACKDKKTSYHNADNRTMELSQPSLQPEQSTDLPQAVKLIARTSFDNGACIITDLKARNGSHYLMVSTDQGVTITPIIVQAIGDY